MREETTTRTLYNFEELSEEAKAHAIENLNDINTDYEWYEATFDDVKEIGRIMGIDISNIFFSGFSSKGDGACFEGRYEYAKGSVPKIGKYAPKDETLRQIAWNLRDIQRKASYKLVAYVRHSGHYYHEYCTEIAVYTDHGEEYADADTDKALTDALRSFMRWIYRQLESYYDYQTGDEAIRETLEANDYEFTEDGDLA